VIRQRCQHRGIALPVRQCRQQTASAHAKQIGNPAGQFDMRLFQQCRQLVLQPHPVSNQLLLAARHRPPQTLFGIRHKAQDQFLRYQPFHQTFGVGEIVLAPARSAVGPRLRQMQRP
jgi:hypothetical protein